MGYYLANDNQQVVNRTFDFSRVRPTLLRSSSYAGQETHTPCSPMQDRGLRFYSPRLGRFIGRDPIRERGSINLYLFVENNSLSYIDYLGRSTMVVIDAVDVSEVWALIYRVGFFCRCDSSGSCAWERAGGSGNQGLLHTIVAPWLRMEQKVQYKVTKSGWLSFLGTITGVITGSNAAGLIIEAINSGTTQGSRYLVGDLSTEEVNPLPELKDLGACTCDAAVTADTKDELYLKVFDLGETVENVTVPTN